MSAPDSPDIVQKTIIVRCDLDAAFRTWAEQINAWWPKDHSRSGDPGTTVFLERHVGGRLYERTQAGVDYVWGEVLAWDPPRHLAYHWYLGSSAEQPTRVDVRFTAEDNGSTRVEVSHQGPALIGELWSRNCAIFDAAWERLLPAYSAACQLTGERL
jgi:uncharacterized protein YndB with AHSA1/START domain